MNASAFVRALAAVQLEDVFNPYADTCGLFDRADAASTRRSNLRSYLRSVEEQGADTLWMGRDLGYRGGRRTGLALTDEYHLAEVPSLYAGTVVARATNGSAVAERTAAEIWAALRLVRGRPLLWNVFPLHPHEHGSELTNRRFSSRELEEVDGLNADLISWLRIRRIVCIGQDAERYAKRYCDAVTVVRHPSYGGTSDFRRGIAEAYGVSRREVALEDRQRTMFDPGLAPKTRKSA
jgi:hypothetical protein